MAAATDHQIRAAMTGSPTSTQAPTARVSIPLALRSANQSARGVRWGIIQQHSNDATRAPTRERGLRTGRRRRASRWTMRSWLTAALGSRPARPAAGRAATGLPVARRGEWIEEDTLI